MSRLNIGDVVTIHRRVDKQNGWTNAWVDRMDGWIGQQSSVVSISTRKGVRLEGIPFDWPSSALYPLPSQMDLF